MRFDFPFLWCSWCYYFCFCPPPVSAFPPILYPANLLDPESDSNIRMIIAHLPGWTRAHAEAAALSRRCGCWSPRLLGGFSSELVSPHNALDVLPLRCVSLFVFCSLAVFLNLVFRSFVVFLACVALYVVLACSYSSANEIERTSLNFALRNFHRMCLKSVFRAATRALTS